MIENSIVLQWLKSYVHGLREGLGDSDEEWERGAIWALGRVENHLIYLITFFTSKEFDNGNNQGRED